MSIIECVPMSVGYVGVTEQGTERVTVNRGLYVCLWV